MARKKSGIVRFKKSLVDEIIEGMEQYLIQIKGGDQHFSDKSFRDQRGAASFAVTNMISHAKALKEYRYHAQKRNKKLKP